jgi:hypothetical protein
MMNQMAIAISFRQVGTACHKRVSGMCTIGILLKWITRLPRCEAAINGTPSRYELCRSNLRVYSI